LEIYSDKQIKDYAVINKIEWIFITPFAPWRGGQYERLIGVVKHHLKRVIRKKTLTIEEMWTLLIEVEKIVNERPITFMSESEVIKPLRPIDLAFPMLKDNEVDIADTNYERNDPSYFDRYSSRDSLISKYKQATNAVEHFWKEWRTSYLMSLREKHLNCASKPRLIPEEGDIVIVLDKNIPRNRWNLAKITKIVSERTAKIKIGEKEFERAIKSLFPLELEQFPNKTREQIETEQESKTKKTVTNCIIKTITLISRPGLDTLSAPLINVEHCKYSEGYCHIAEESIVVWNIEPKEGTNAFWYNDKRRCVFKKFVTRNGTLYRNGWLSNPNDLALTFAEDPRTIMSCEEWLVISEQGIAVEQRQYDLMHGLIRNRKRREKELGILEGSVEVSQLESQMQARSLFADRELRRAFATYSKMLCEYITDSALSGEDFSHLNPTLIIRKLANTNEIEARWIDKNILEFWPCTTIHKYHFTPTDGTCYRKLTVNVSISDSENYIKAFLDPLTFILSRQADKSQCEQNRIIAVVLNGIVTQVDQLTGKISQVKEISTLTSQNKEWSIKLPKTDLQIFRKLIITNLSHPQLEMLQLIKSFQMNEFNPYKIATKSKGEGPSGNRYSLDAGILQTLWPVIDIWMILTRVVVLSVLLTWFLKLYNWYVSIRMKRTIKHELNKDNLNRNYKQILELPNNTSNRETNSEKQRTRKNCRSSNFVGIRCKRRTLKRKYRNCHVSKFSKGSVASTH